MTQRDELAGIRQEYSRQSLSPEDCLPDPLAQLDRWLDEALKSGLKDATAMHLATVGADGRPSARMVLLKGLEHGRLVFYTNYDSRKGEQLQANPVAAITFFWPDLERQVRIEGRVEVVPAEVSDAYFASRPYTSRIGAWASLQSQPLDGKTTLVARAAKFSARYLHDVPRPPNWGGYALAPERLEFWQGRPSRLHDRVLYLPVAGKAGEWERSRLYP